MDHGQKLAGWSGKPPPPWSRPWVQAFGGGDRERRESPMSGLPMKEDEMPENMKDKLDDICDENGWEIEFRSDGCTIRTGTTKVEYTEDRDERTCSIRADGRFRTVLRLIRAIEEARFA